MSTCGPEHLVARSEKGTPELFFVATAIKACYGKLPDWEESSEREREVSLEKRPRLLPENERANGYAVDDEYRRLYCLLRDGALSDIKGLVRERVEKLSTPSSSYDFMNIYGMCSFGPPDLTRLAHHKEARPSCSFTGIACPEDNSNSNTHRLITVGGMVNPLISARVTHGELELTHCGESDYHRATEEIARLDSRSKMRAPRVSKGNLGRTIGSMETPFLFTVREDLHELGCAYRQMVVTVELLHLSMIHFIYS